MVNDDRVFTIALPLYVQLKGHFITIILEANLQDFARPSQFNSKSVRVLQPLQGDTEHTGF